MNTERGINDQDLTREDANADGRNAVEIVASLWEKLESLVQLEMKLGLAVAEEKLDALKRDLIAKAIGGSVAFAAMLALVAGLIALMSLVMKVWIAAMITGVALGVTAFALLRRDTKSLPAATTPTTSVDQPTRTELTSTSTTKETSHGTI